MGSQMLKQATLAGALVLLSAAIATAQAPPKNLDVLNAVSRTVNTYSFFTIFDDVSASVHDGVVTLTGKVTMPHKRTDIEARVKALNGVRGVEDKIEVLPVSFFDDALRYRIARAIYSNPNFWYAANMSNPPIHVIVDHGHVTITGVVTNNMDKAIVRSLAGQSGAFSITMDLKTPEEVKDALEHA
jgi:hyperosmotically inducible protein